MNVAHSTGSAAKGDIFARRSSHLNKSHQKVLERFNALPGNIRGALWILLASLGFSAMAVCIKAVGQTVNVWTLVFLRSIIALLILSPAIVQTGPGVMRTRIPGTHITRSLLGMCGMTGFFMAITHLEMALATTLGFTRILFLIVLAIVFLGERIRWRRTIATLVGFCGVLICIQPGAETFDPWTLAGLAGALFAAGVTIMVKRLTRTEAPLTIMVWSYIIMGLCSAALLPWMWHTPNWQELGLIAASALFSTWGQSCMVQGLRAGEATMVAPFEYTRLLYAAALGVALFGEWPAVNTWIGGGVIIVSTAYIGIRETRLARARRRRQPRPRNRTD
jgi:drug/metabolite transporter (DMT)-like permease